MRRIQFLCPPILLCRLYGLVFCMVYVLKSESEVYYLSHLINIWILYKTRSLVLRILFHMPHIIWIHTRKTWILLVISNKFSDVWHQKISVPTRLVSHLVIYWIAHTSIVTRWKSSSIINQRELTVQTPAVRLSISLMPMTCHRFNILMIT